MSSNENWVMPKPNQGDLVLFSNDVVNFTNPALGWVMKEPGTSTVQLLVFTENNGWLVKPSVHHRSDPALAANPYWAELGAWDFTVSTKNKVAEHTPAKEYKNGAARETAAR